MGLFILDRSDKPNIKTRLETAKENLNLFLKHNKSAYNYLITDFSLRYLDDVKTGLSKLTNWHKIEPSQQTIDKFWEEFKESRKHSQSCHSIFVSAFQSALYDHLNDLNLIENSGSDYILVEKEEYYENIVVPINDFVTLRSNKYFPSGKYTNQVIGYTSHPETKKLSYIFENDEITEITKCISLNDKHLKK